METYLFWIVPIASLLALVLAWYFYKQMMLESEGTPTMEKIASYVRQGAMSYLKQQYKVVGLVFLGLVILFSIMAYGFNLQNPWVPIAFLTGGFFSGLSGFLGMKTATYASARTANAAQHSLNKGLRVAFRSGAVMGLVVVGLGLLDISFWYILLDYCIPTDALNPSAKLCVITTTMLTFGMGASTQALFARVGGGIYTKAADVGADLVGKVEAGIPEDDPRNPATIADNVGDNVGDVAGMGADLYESYCGSILATAALGAAAFIGSDDTVMQFKAVIAPMLIAAVGIVLSIIGIFAVRTKENAGMKELLGSLATGTNLSSVLIVVATFLILWALGLENWVNISFAVVVGLIVGIVIGRSTEYYTSQSYKPTQRLAESGKTGPATVIISGIGLGMVSTTIPVLAVVTGIILSYWLASGFDFANISMGLYGIGIAAVGMLSTLGITLATDAYGPIPYSQIGVDGSIKSPYDSEQQVYAKFFEELNASIKIMNEQSNDRLTASADYIYSGDVKKWIRFANSLKLRLAMRIVNADPTTARKMVEEALDPQYGGVIEQNADNAAWRYFAGSVTNPIYTATQYNHVLSHNDDKKECLTGGDTHAAADIICYMNGYNDPRREKYFVKSEWDGYEYVGMRRGFLT